MRNAMSLGIVVELENIEASGAERALTNLRELQRQISGLDESFQRPIRFLVVYDSEVFDEADAQGFIAQSRLGENADISAETIGAAGIHYYEHKNVGARHLDTDLILFMDSDILIAGNWLEKMLAPFEEDTVNYVSGQTLIDTDGLFDKIYALTDPGFPLEETRQKGLTTTRMIAANAFALRRSRIVDGRIFPEITAYRGHCAVAAQRLVKGGHILHKQLDAVARHPSPDGLGGYFARAYAEGCDAITISRFNARTDLRGRINRGPVGALHRFARGCWGVLRRSVTRFERVGLPVYAVPLAILAGWSYFTVRLFAEIVAMISLPLAMRLSIAKQGH